MEDQVLTNGVSFLIKEAARAFAVCLCFPSTTDNTTTNHHLWDRMSPYQSQTCWRLDLRLPEYPRL